MGCIGIDCEGGICDIVVGVEVGGILLVCVGYSCDLGWFCIRGLLFGCFLVVGFGVF